MEGATSCLQTSKPAYQKNGQTEQAPVRTPTNTYQVLLEVTGRVTVLGVSTMFTGVNRTAEASVGGYTSYLYELTRV